MAARFRPSIVSANDLMTGRAVWQTASGGWSSRPGDAEICFDEDMAGQRLEAALAREDAVAGPYLTAVRLGPDGEIEPLALRDRFRVTGPTIRLPGGAQAQD